MYFKLKALQHATTFTITFTDIQQWQNYQNCLNLEVNLSPGHHFQQFKFS
jgi:hypothetical protein